MKGIILAGGTGSRLFPLTKSISKQLLPIYNKPMIYYPLSILMNMRIKEVLIITKPEELNLFQNLLRDGSQLGMKINYEIQNKPSGIAEAIIIAENFLKKDSFCLVLGDNFFYGQDFSNYLNKAKSFKSGATIFASEVKNPSDFGVVKIDKNKKIISIVEKPKKYLSNLAITGIYIYDKLAVKLVKNLKPSKRGELEITDLNKIYLSKNQLRVQIMPNEFTWFDNGNCNSLLETSNFVSAIERQKGIMIGCLEEVAYKNKWISKKVLLDHVRNNMPSNYGQNLKKFYNKC